MGGEDKRLQESSRSGIWVIWCAAEIILACHYELLVRVFDLLPNVVVVRRCGETTQAVLLPLLPTLSALLGASDGDTGGVVWPPTTSSPEACRVATSSNSLAVFGCS
jgi:hypothetical protein